MNVILIKIVIIIVLIIYFSCVKSCIHVFLNKYLGPTIINMFVILCPIVNFLFMIYSLKKGYIKRKKLKEILNIIGHFKDLK